MKMQDAIQKANELVPYDGEITPEDYKALLDEIGATPQSLKRDAVTLREWSCSQPHHPQLTSELQW